MMNQLGKYKQENTKIVSRKDKELNEMEKQKKEATEALNKQVNIFFILPPYVYQIAKLN